MQFQVNIRILDENDSIPKFFGNSHEVTKLSEDALPGYLIAKVVAEDSDLESDLTYSIDLRSQAYMTIDAGDLTLTSPIDREEYDKFEVKIEVTDGVHTNSIVKTVEVSKKYFPEIHKSD